VLRAFAGAALAVLGYAGATTAAVGPAHGSYEIETPAATASLVRSGDELLITGSVSHIFSTGSFAGPNRAEKQDRLRPVVDVVAMTTEFDNIRARLAAMRHPEAAAPTSVAVATTPSPSAPTWVPDPAADGAALEAPVMVASLQAPVETEALTAIDGLAGGDAPIPRSLSEQLAYGRADVPATIFDGSVKDRQGKKVSDKEYNCLATAIYFEARGETYRGQIAVGQVVLNRVAHRLYPDTICSVVYQNQHKRNACQFSFACDGIPERVTESKAWETAQEVARGVLDGTLFLPEVAYATHYHATYVYPHWAPRMKKEAKIGLHVFYRFKRGWKFG
jgi:spore germination cell wall hydrolase CwlJ-like protein